MNDQSLQTANAIGALTEHERSAVCMIRAYLSPKKRDMLAAIFDASDAGDTTRLAALAAQLTIDDRIHIALIFDVDERRIEALYRRRDADQRRSQVQA